MREADFVVAISRTVRDQLREMADARPEVRVDPERIVSFRLGCDLDLVEHAGPVRDQVRALFDSPGQTWISVGTICDRKNQGYTLDAFDRLWKRRPDLKLCFIGLAEDVYLGVAGRIRKHPRFGRQLFHFTDLSDTEVDYCYRHADGAILASIIEGFGLPLVEALSRRLPTLASDIPVLREVGGEFAAYFDLADPGSLAALVERFGRDGKLPGVRNPADYDHPDWDAATREFLQRVCKVAGIRPASRSS
jgi:alpha-1,2-rhamnosyltransferase